MRFDNYKFRCSSLGKIMTANRSTTITSKQVIELAELETKFIDGKITDKQNEKRLYYISKRDAKPELSQGSQRYCKDLVKSVLFNREKEFHSKYTDKGTIAEDDGITLLSDVYNKMMFKNEKHYANSHIQGTPDIVNDKVTDLKCSWDLFSYPLFDDEINNSLYEWQIKAYCWLTGRNEGNLIYCMVDTPINIINDEIRRLDWAISLLDGNGNVYEDKIPDVVNKISMMIYTRKGLEDFCHQDVNIDLDWFDDFIEIPKNIRVKKYDLELSTEDIEQIKEQVTLSREYMNELESGLKLR